MESIHELSSVAPLPEFDLWGVPPTQITVEKDIEIEYRPLSVVDTSSPISFQFVSASDEYVKLDSIYLYWVMQVKLFKNNVAATTAEDWQNISAINYLQHSMIRQVNISINNKQVFHLPQNYSYRAYLEALLGFSQEAKINHLTSAFWRENIDDQLFAADGFDQSKSKKIDMFSRLHTDLTFQGRSLIGGCKFDLEIILNNPKFYLILKDNYTATVELSDVSLYVHKAKITSMIVDAHKKALAISSAKYPITRTEVKQFAIPSGLIDLNIDNLVFGQLPRRMFVVLVSNDAFNGSNKKDPYSFQHFDLNYISVFLDGNQFPNKPYTPNFANKLYIREYLALFQALNQNGTDCFLKMSRDDFYKKPIFAFNFAPDCSDGCGMVGHVNQIKRGSLRLQIKFSKPLTEAINVVAFCEFDNIIEIFNDGTVLNGINNGFSSNN